MRMVKPNSKKGILKYFIYSTLHPKKNGTERNQLNRKMIELSTVATQRVTTARCNGHTIPSSRALEKRTPDSEWRGRWTHEEKGDSKLHGK